MSAGQANLPRQISDERSSWPIFVISLTTASARRLSCQAAMDRLGLKFEFFDAVRGSDLSREDVAKVYDPAKNAKSFKRPLSKPEIGCYLSHHALWDRIAKGGYAGAIVLEDDFDADDALPALLHEVCRLNLLNCLVKLHSERKVEGATVAELGGGYRLLAPRRIPGFAVGYVVERAAATALAEKSLPFARPVDIDLKHWWEFGVSVLMVQPSVLRIRLGDGESASAIESSRQSAKPAGRFSDWMRLVRNARYQCRYQLQCVRARPKLRLIVDRFKVP